MTELHSAKHDIFHPERSPEALIFDFDGVLADTETLYWRAWQEILQEHGISFTWQDYCRIGRGHREERMIESLLTRAVDAAARDTILNSLSARTELILKWKQERSPISATTAKLIRSLKAWPLGLVTSSDRSDILPLLQAAGIEDQFHATVFGEEIADHKPHPAPYLLMQQKLGIRGGAAFEDSEPGLLSARSAGYIAVHVPSPEELPRLVREVIGRPGGLSHSA